jgi:hypothetical protein
VFIRRQKITQVKPRLPIDICSSPHPRGQVLHFLSIVRRESHGLFLPLAVPSLQAGSTLVMQLPIDQKNPAVHPYGQGGIMSNDNNRNALFAVDLHQ